MAINSQTVRNMGVVMACATLAMMLSGGGGCRSDAITQSVTASNLTAGMAKKNIIKDKTTQAEVMEIFGPPDLVTHKDDLQVWTYDKIRYDVQSSGAYLTVLLAGVGEQKARSSSTSTMLIIYFDSNDVVRDYRMNVTKF